VEQLATAAFMETAHNLILVGGTGTGKTHLAAAISQYKHVHFFNAIDLVNRLELGKLLSKASNLTKQLYLVERRHSRKGVVILVSSKTCTHSPKDKLVVMIRDVFS
jgi:replication-associated recombination protein RarA